VDLAFLHYGITLSLVMRSRYDIYLNSRNIVQHKRQTYTDDNDHNYYYCWYYCHQCYYYFLFFFNRPTYPRKPMLGETTTLTQNLHHCCSCFFCWPVAIPVMQLTASKHNKVHKNYYKNRTVSSGVYNSTSFWIHSQMRRIK